MCSRGRGCCFPWKTITLLLVVASLALVNEDVKRSAGKFAKSRTGVFFADIGLYDHAEKTYELCARGQKWTLDNVPIYYSQAKDAVQPYCSKVASAASDAGTYASKQTHLLTEKLNSWWPGAKQKTSAFFAEALRITCNVLSVSIDGCTNFLLQLTDLFQRGLKANNRFMQKLLKGKIESSDVTEPATSAREWMVERWDWLSRQVKYYIVDDRVEVGKAPKKSG